PRRPPSRSSGSGQAVLGSPSLVLDRCAALCQTAHMTGPEICQSHLPVAPWMDALGSRLPGLQPVAPGQWLQRADAFNAQMAYRDRLIAERFDTVVAGQPYVSQAERDLLAAVTNSIEDAPGYRRRGNAIIRPDGVSVGVTAHRPLVVAARLVQEDLLMLEARSGGHVLTSRVLCFPASWTLRAKLR